MMIRRTALIGLAFLTAALATACNDAAPTEPSAGVAGLAQSSEAAEPPGSLPDGWCPSNNPTGMEPCNFLGVNCRWSRDLCQGTGQLLFKGGNPVHGDVTILYHPPNNDPLRRIAAFDVRIGQLDRALAPLLRERKPLGAIVRAVGPGAPSVQTYNVLYLVARSVDPASGTIRYTVMQGPQT